MVQYVLAIIVVKGGAQETNKIACAGLNPNFGKERPGAEKHRRLNYEILRTIGPAYDVLLDF